jgi:hypothetical protein
MKKRWRIVIIFFLGVGVACLAAYRMLPVYRVGVHSQLVMLADLNNDHHWDEKDAVALHCILEDPFSCPVLNVVKIDVNRNGRLDSEDLEFLQRLYRCKDPYAAEAEAIREAHFFPRPREWFRYIPDTEYVKRPLFTLDHPACATFPVSFLSKGQVSDESDYTDQLRQEIYNEGIRFTLAYKRREKHLTDVERAYATRKFAEVKILAEQGHDFDLLLMLIGMTEDVETLKAPEAGSFMGRLLYCRDHLRDLLHSSIYRDFEAGKATYRDVFKKMEAILAEDLNVSIDLESAPPPRNLLQPRNYVQRAVWQFFKSSSRREEFIQLLLYAQYDPRYLRAVSRTSRPHQDLDLQNHNLPMVLLFREALRIKKGDKKAAVGLLDEAIRIPFAWVKRIPREKLPSSVALDNFLLPGSKEDGSDKSRHWNVFGGISLYKSPEESMLLALEREIKDARESNYTPEALTEFIRDMIANMNGIYHVVLLDPVAAL